MTLRPEELAELIDAYLDGRLNDDQRARLETMASSDPALSAELQAARAAEASLRRLFAPPEPEALVPDVAAFHPPAAIPFPVHHGSAHSAPTIPAAVVSQAPAGPRAAGPAPADSPPTLVARASRRPLWIALAAVFALAASAAVYFVLQPVRDPAVSPKAALTPGQLYANLMKKKFKPAFVCENDDQFAKFLGDRFGSGAVLAHAPAVEVLGWDYADGMIGEATAVVMARVAEKEVVLVVDEKKFDRPLAPPGSGLHMFRDVCNGLVFYEITPFDEARLLPLIKAASPLVLRTD